MNADHSNLLQLLDQAEKNPNDKELFQKVISGTLGSGIMDEDEMVRKLRISYPTLRRWRDGASAMHSFGRPGLYTYIREYLEKL